MNSTIREEDVHGQPETISEFNAGAKSGAIVLSFRRRVAPRRFVVFRVLERADFGSQRVESC
ncbi:MAG: hypothetical protein ABSE85_19985 [Candidatus Korobacteraceae bacterium]